jgi:hypothetical protein
VEGVEWRAMVVWLERQEKTPIELLHLNNDEFSMLQHGHPRNFLMFSKKHLVPIPQISIIRKDTQ